MENIDWNDLLDRYAQGTLNQAERIVFEGRMADDAGFRREAEQHQEMYQSMKLYGGREKMKKTLASFEKDLTVPSLQSKKQTLIKKYWPTIAVAASVAFVSIVGTMLMTQSIQTQQTAIYKELRRNVAQVEQIKKSQNLLLADIAKNSPNTNPHRGRYAGSGFLISSNGYLVTSYHVVKGADSVFIENDAYGILKAAVVVSDAENDVAILRVDADSVKVHKLPYTISLGEANLGEDVFTLGFPREDIVFGEGSISALSGYEQNPNAYQVSVPVNPGNSGGPLFNGKGDLVGIISGIQTETSGAAFAIKSSVLLSVIEKAPADSTRAPLVLPKQNSLRGMSKVEQVKKWKENVFVVRVFNNK
jgi:serine protease Do